jgi:hypothetical protein
MTRTVISEFLFRAMGAIPHAAEPRQRKRCGSEGHCIFIGQRTHGYPSYTTAGEVW